MVKNQYQQDVEYSLSNIADTLQRKADQVRNLAEKVERTPAEELKRWLGSTVTETMYSVLNTSNIVGDARFATQQAYRIGFNE